jgi:hypothetical protein
MGAGLVDSYFLSLAWTVVVLRVTAAHGLGAAAVCGTAMLVGVALSAPVAGWLSTRLDGRRLLRSAAAVEGALRLSVFVLLAVDASVWLLSVCVLAMNVMAWTGYAAMRAEVAAASRGATGLTWYGTVVASVEAVGVASAALLPRGGDWLLLGVAACYVLALLPTVVVAGTSPVPRRPAAVRRGPVRRALRVSPTTVSGFLLMTFSSGPTLLAVALAAEMHGRRSVGFAAAAFTVGSLAAPFLVARLQARPWHQPTIWVWCAVGMVGGWVLAPLSVGFLCLAQLASGLCMTALEGLLDGHAAARSPDHVTAALAEATAGRALGSALGTAVLPFVVAGAGLGLGATVTTACLAAVASGLTLRRRRTGAPSTASADVLPVLTPEAEAA